ncbi:MAG: hypothetical protein H5U18_03300 [Rhodobacteraceae bacterium]|nr:hypothetical protein [Paracoccaceae bacterium]
MSIVLGSRNQLARTLNEIGLHLGAVSARLSDPVRPKVLFCPSSGREGASLLRAYNMADSLAARGWHADCVSPLARPAGRKRIIRSFAPDLLVFQQCRHALNAPEHAGGVAYVLDTDDADFYLEIPGLAARLDRTSRNAAAVIAGSRFLRDWHSQRCPNVSVIWTGTPISPGERPGHKDRTNKGRPILAWAQAKPLAYRQELDHVATLAAGLLAREVPFALRFYGIDSASDAEELRGRMPRDVLIETRPTLPYADFLKSLQEVAVGLSPIIASSPFSRGKSFGKILGYLDAKVPVIASDEADHALFFDGRNGIVSNSLEDWMNAAARLLTDADARQAMADTAFGDFEDRLSLEAAADRTDKVLRGLVQRLRQPGAVGVGGIRSGG